MKCRAAWHGVVIAESDDCIVIGGTYYFPPDSLKRTYLRPSDHRSECPWKGSAHYFDIVVKDQVNESAAWTYPQPKGDFGHIRNYTAFWNGVAVGPDVLGPLSGGINRGRTDYQPVLNFLLDVPKTEIHLHLEATAGVHSVFDLIQKNKLAVKDIQTQEDLLRRFQVKNLNDFVALFIEIIQPCIQTENDFVDLVQGARDYLVRNRIDYAEIFFAPTNFLKRGMDFGRIVGVLDQEARRYREENT